MLIIIYLILAALVANYGAKREIGAAWSFFFSVFFSPLLGFIIASDAPKIKGGIIVREPNFWSNLFCIIFFITSIFLFYTGFKGLAKDTFGYDPLERQQLQSAIWVFSLAIGFLGASGYVSRYKEFRYKKKLEPDLGKNEISKPSKVDELTIELRELLKNNDPEINKKKEDGL